MTTLWSLIFILNFNGILIILGIQTGIQKEFKNLIKIKEGVEKIITNHQNLGITKRRALESLLEDLKKSRESLNNTTYFCYPFYDYNDRAIELLKQAGFTMAFAGQNGNDVKVGQDKFKIPRYVIYSNTSMNTFVNYVS